MGVILCILGESGPLSFSEIADSAKDRYPVSPPKISRRLKHLVDLDLIHREVTADWPPRTIYSKGSPSKYESRIPGQFRRLLGIIGLALIVMGVLSIVAPGLAMLVALLLVGGYLVLVGFGFERHLQAALDPICERVKKAGNEGKLTRYLYILAASLSGLMATNTAYRVVTHTRELNPEFALRIYMEALPILLLVVVIVVLGRAMTLYFKDDGRIRGFLLQGLFVLVFLVALQKAFAFFAYPGMGASSLILTLVFWGAIYTIFVRLVKTEPRRAGSIVSM